VAALLLGLLLLVGKEPELTGESFDHRPGVFEKQSERVRLGGGFQGLASGYGSKIQVAPALVRATQLRRGESPEPHPVRRSDGQDVRGVRPIRPAVRNRGAAVVLAGMLQVKPVLLGRFGLHRGVEPEAARVGQLNRATLHDPHNSRRGIPSAVRSGGHTYRRAPRGCRVEVDHRRS